MMPRYVIILGRMGRVDGEVANAHPCGAVLVGPPLKQAARLLQEVAVLAFGDFGVARVADDVITLEEHTMSSAAEGLDELDVGLRLARPG